MRIIVVWISILFSSHLFAQSNWAPTGIPFHVSSIRAMYTDSIEDVLWVGGDIFDGNPSQQVLLKYDGQDWIHYGYFNGQIMAITRFQDKIIVGGIFTSYNGVDCPEIAYLNGDGFETFGNGADFGVSGLRVLEDDLYVTGNFHNIGGQAIKMVAKFDGENWSNLEGFPIVDEFDTANDVCIFNDKIFVGGNYDPWAWEETDESDIFFSENGVWFPAGGGISGSVSQVAVIESYDGELIVGGAIYQSAGNAGHSIMKWRESDNSWEAIGGSLTGANFSTSSPTVVRDMKVYQSKLLILGIFDNAGDIPAQNIAMWDGERYCSFGGVFTGYGGGEEMEIYHDTLFIGCTDSVDGQFVNNLAKYVGDWNFENCSTVGAEELESNLNDLHLFPNPIEDILSFRTSLSIDYWAVMDMTGRVILTEKRLQHSIEDEWRVDVSSLAPGTYVLQCVLDDGRVLGKRFVK